MRALLLALPLLLANTAAEDPVIPPTIKSMLDAAMQSGSEGDVAVIVKYARNADPASADLVVKIATDWRNERLAQLESAARQLSPSQWEYFRLHHLEDVPIEDIARDAHVSRDAIKSHLYRARKVLLAR